MGKCLQGKDDDAESTSSSRSNRLKRPAPQDGTVESEPSTSAAGLIAKDNKDDDKEGNNPFHLLVKAARLMNPVQFELSKDIACSTPLPGTFLGGVTFYNCIVPVGFLPWEIRVAFPGESQLLQSRTTQPTVHAGCCSVSIIHRTLTWITGSLTCTQILMHAIAHEGYTDTRKRVCTES